MLVEGSRAAPAFSGVWEGPELSENAYRGLQRGRKGAGRHKEGLEGGKLEDVGFGEGWARQRHPQQQAPQTNVNILAVARTVK